MRLDEKQLLLRNEQLLFLTTLYGGIFKDAIVAFKGIVSMRVWNRDIDRSLSLLSSRGLGFFTHDLPELDKDLMSLLTTGIINFSRPLFGKLHKPRLFSGLWYLIINDDGTIRSDADPNAILFLRQFSLFAKKANVCLKTDKLRRSKIDGYYAIEESIHSPSERWFNDNFHGLDPDDGTSSLVRNSYDLFNESEESHNRSALCTTIQQVFDFFSRQFDDIEEFRLVGEDCVSYYGTKHGPGATALTSSATDKWAFKHINPRNRNILERLKSLEDVLWASDTQVADIDSRLISVPKDSGGPRLIAAEPIVNQYLQQHIFKFIQFGVLRDTILGQFVDFSSQEKSKEMAKIGSIDGSLATLDLKDASDRLSLKLVESAFREAPTLLKFIHSCRTPIINIDGDRLLLKKYASQGNASTFPVQSIIYAMMAIGGVLHHRKLEVSERNIRSLRRVVRTFGDDIIVPTDCSATVIDALVINGLMVNTNKSFSTGFFRESCGGDFYKGYDITPVKIRVCDTVRPEGQQMLIDVSNDAYRKGFWHLAEALMLHFRYWNRGFPLLPITKFPTGGNILFSYSSSYSYHLKSRWYADLHQIQVKVWFTSNKKWKVKRSSQSRVNQSYLSDISRYGTDDSYVQRSQSISKIGWRQA